MSTVFFGFSTSFQQSPLSDGLSVREMDGFFRSGCEELGSGMLLIFHNFAVLLAQITKRDIFSAWCRKA